MTRPADILRSSTLVAVLGAGSARRFGAAKLTQPCAGKPLGQWALEAALGTGLPVVWVAGAEVPNFVSVDVIRNEHADEGMGTSVACVAHQARAMGAARLLVMLADMPLVTTGLLDELLATPAPAACAWGGKAGVPALFAADHFALLEGLSGDRGAAAVLRGLDGVSLLHTAPEVMRDVDTPQDLAEMEPLILNR